MSTLSVTNINTDILKIDSITAKTVDANLVLTSSNTEAGTLTIRNTGGLTFVHNSSATSNAIAINSQGNVGIGTTSAPNAKLQIVGAANVSGNAVITGTLSSGNTTITGFANITSTLACGNVTITGTANVSTNTFNLGSSSKTSNGYTYLPNGLIFQWGDVVANTTSGNVTFSVAFPTGILQSVCTSNNQLSGEVGIEAQSTTGLQLRCESITNPASILVRYLAIGY